MKKEVTFTTGEGKKVVFESQGRKTKFAAILVPESVRKMFIKNRGDKTNGDYLLELMRK